jgi:putative DNA methylase
LPLLAINEAAAADKDRKTGTMRGIHKWFAPMPPPAWTALLAAALIDDPDDDAERGRLLAVISAALPRDGGPPSSSQLQALRRLLPTDGPTIVDPFCGGGSTLVEAERLGLKALGGDLNPVPATISRTLAQLLPACIDARQISDADGQASADLALPYDGLIADLRAASGRVLTAAKAAVADLYPPEDRCHNVIAWLWCRTARCPNPGCECLVPLYGSPWLSKQPGSEAWLRPRVVDGRVEFEVATTGAVDPPTRLKGASFRCPACGDTLIDDYLETVGNGGGFGRRLLATAFTSDRRRWFEVGPPDDVQSQLFPDETPDIAMPNHPRYLCTPKYGLRLYRDLFLPRQVRTLLALAHAIANEHNNLLAIGVPPDSAKAISTLLGLALGKLAQSNSTQCTWRVRKGPSKIEAALGRQALPMTWDFPEANPFGGSVGDWLMQVESVIRSIRTLPTLPASGQVLCRDARDTAKSLAPGSVLVATDPPYFDQIGYADLSDYFYPWLRTALKEVHPDLFRTIAAPRDTELVADRYRHPDGEAGAYRFFVDGFTETLGALAAAQDTRYPLLIVYAHQQQDQPSHQTGGGTGWEAMLEAVIAAGLAIVGTWPLRATSRTRLRSIESNALSSYVVMVCRPMSATAPATTLRDFLTKLRAELPGRLRILQQGSIAPVDIGQAALGPGMAIFTSYRDVLATDGAPLSVRAALAAISTVLAEVLTAQEGDFDEDTRFCLAWFRQFAWGESGSGTADAFARQTNSSIARLERVRIFRARAGKARLLAPEDLDLSWDPNRHEPLSSWEFVLRMAQALAVRGVDAAASVMAAGRSHTDLDLARDLAYLLYSISDQRNDHASALLFNGLGTFWSDLIGVSHNLSSQYAMQEQSTMAFGTEEPQTYGNE